MNFDNLYGPIPKVETHNTVRAFKEKDGRYRLIGSQCPDCGQKWFPRRFICPTCHGQNLQPYACAQTGEIVVSWVDNMGFPTIGYEDIEDRLIAMVKLDDGIHVIAEIAECKQVLPKGTRVEMVIRQQKRDDTGNLVYGYKFKISE